MTVIKFEIDTDKINSLQLEDLKKQLELASIASHTDIDFRINGEYEKNECDWLKHLRIIE